MKLKGIWGVLQPFSVGLIILVFMSSMKFKDAMLPPREKMYLGLFQLVGGIIGLIGIGIPFILTLKAKNNPEIKRKYFQD
ncbi:MAG: hypothetical protein WC889_16975 [Myxococcota bacterium]